MPEITMGVNTAVESAEANRKEIGSVVKEEELPAGAMSLKSPAASKIAAALEKGNQALEQQTKQRIVVINPEEMPPEIRDLVKRLQDLDQALVDNRHVGLDRLKGDRENPRNVKDLELDRKIKEDLDAHLKLRSEKINQLAREILFLYDWYQIQPGMTSMPTHALQFKEVITKPPKQTKGLRRKKTAT